MFDHVYSNTGMSFSMYHGHFLMCSSMTQEILELRNKGMPRTSPLHLHFQQQTTTTLAITKWLCPTSPDHFCLPHLRALILLLPWHGSLHPQQFQRECL